MGVNEFIIFINLDHKIRHLLLTHLIGPPEVGVFQLKRNFEKRLVVRKDKVFCKLNAVFEDHKLQLMFAIV